MRRQRVVHADARESARLTLEASDLHHFVTVVRLRAGAEVEVLDGAGATFDARYLGPAPPQLEILSRRTACAAQDDLTVALATLRASRMDWVVEKLSELGVGRLVPLASERSTGAVRLERWRRIARESAKQCGRATLLEIGETRSLEQVAAEAREAELALVLDREGETLDVLSTRIATASSLTLLCGPEGGFSDSERERLAEFQRFRLAVPTLRAETAAVSGAAVATAVRAGRLGDARSGQPPAAGERR